MAAPRAHESSLLSRVTDACHAAPRTHAGSSCSGQQRAVKGPSTAAMSSEVASDGSAWFPRPRGAAPHGPGGVPKRWNHTSGTWEMTPADVASAKAIEAKSGATEASPKLHPRPRGAVRPPAIFFPFKRPPSSRLPSPTLAASRRLFSQMPSSYFFTATPSLNFSP